MKAVIVGAGLTSAVAASFLIKKGWNVVVFETRDHIAGNCFDFKQLLSTNKKIMVHKYGPHAFHTNDEKVWNYVNQFSKFTDFRLQVKAELSNGEIIPIPFNDISKKIVGN